MESPFLTCRFVCVCLFSPSVISDFSDPMDCSPPDSFVHGISQAWILEWVAISFSKGSSWLMDRTHISCIGRWILYHWAMREAQLQKRIMLKASGNSSSLKTTWKETNYMRRPLYNDMWHYSLSNIGSQIFSIENKGKSRFTESPCFQTLIRN